MAEICPFISMGNEIVECKKNDCKIFLQAEQKPPGVGSCAFSRIGSELRMIFNRLSMTK